MSDFNDLLRQAIARRPPSHPAWRYNSKLKGRQLAESWYVPVPRLLQGPCSIMNMRPPESGSFVVKPNKGHSGRGVLALVPAGDDLFVNLLQPAVEPSTWGRWRHLAMGTKKLPSVTNNDRVRHPWIMEELIGETTTPDEWKFYGFADGSLPLVRQRRVRPDGVSANRFWQVASDHFTPVNEDVETRRFIDDSLTAPSALQSRLLIARARRIAQAACRPFARVDFLLDSDGESYFGEVTPEPSAGKREILEPWNTILGDHWATAIRYREERPWLPS